jgi:hypothetical protein
VEDIAVGFGSGGGWPKVSFVPNPKPSRGERADGLQVAFCGGCGLPDVAKIAGVPKRAPESRTAEIAVEIQVRYRAGRIDDHQREVRVDADGDAYGAWSAWAIAQADRIEPTRDIWFLGEAMSFATEP